jgi:hypothetical protein
LGGVALHVAEEARYAVSQRDDFRTTDSFLGGRRRSRRAPGRSLSFAGGLVLGLHGVGLVATRSAGGEAGEEDAKGDVRRRIDKYGR